ncbi:acyl transferase/acyl hydrolase/lysophospholipase [Apodospora peruviana]|uniref:Acyl transferase/acyl hydrolase/lysophospholipase n=1 Tax=Apodospora peruviana TaxID=516989 RepID=A0AAE0IHJ9_9PEZI|nr:acyl transferase/acyl hydrolase/lysophospholipase [Apodospora peruviana]
MTHLSGHGLVPVSARSPIGLNLLCLDGGGIRGLSSLYILKQLMESIDMEKPPLPCDYFDMIGGTSTGGLIAIMLGRLRMSVDECIDTYRAMAPRIFTKVNHRLNLRGKVQGRFDHVAVEDGVKDLLRKRLLSENELLFYSRTEPCKTFVCSTSKQTGNTVQAARATSAATSFFDPIEIGNEEFVDGATPANNPITEVWSEAYDLFSDSGDSSWDLEENISCLVSIGTGVPNPRPFGDDPLRIGAKLVKIATDTEKKAEDFAKHHPRLCKEGHYFRFNVRKGLENIGLEEEAKYMEIISSTR